MQMDFKNRIKKGLTEAVVKSILVDAGYRVLDFGIESQIRELECLTALEYLGLDFPTALRSMPDLLVMDREQTLKHLVEVKFRSGWNVELLLEIEEQVRLFKEVVLICLNTQPVVPAGRLTSPASYLRCCRLTFQDERYCVELNDHGEKKWLEVGELGTHDGQWWGLRPLQEIFAKVDDRREAGTLFTAIGSIKGLIEA